MAKVLSILCVAAIVGCAPERIVTDPRPITVAANQAKSDSAYVAMCEDWPGASIRLYGCNATGYRSRGEPLIIVGGNLLPTDTIGRGKVKRERALAALDPSRIKRIEAFGRDDPGMLAKYGNAARGGVIVITLLEIRAKQAVSQQPKTR
jgi:hypothetical protein